MVKIDDMYKKKVVIKLLSCIFLVASKRCWKI